MFKSDLTIPLVLCNQNVLLNIYGDNNICEIEEEEAIANGESRFQIKEGNFYEYKITDGFYLQCTEYISQSKIRGQESSGRITPNIYVGTLSIVILNNEKKYSGEIKLEVQSVKTSYRQDYRHMLEEITEKCTDLLMKHSSPVSQFFEVNFDEDANTLYQRFAFIKSILDSEEFTDSIHKFLSAPVTKWKDSETEKDIRGIKRISNSALRQIATAANRINLPNGHPLKSSNLQSIPTKIRTSYKIETVDTPENRFVKHALNYFLRFIGDFRVKLKDTNRLKEEAILLEDKIEQFLSYEVFKEISLPSSLSLNSPVLQRKEGYREILRVWLMFDLAAKLVWHGGNDVYSGGKRGVAVLYEYWLFFKLLDTIKEVFKVAPKSIEELIKETDDGLGLQLKQGKYIPLKGIYINKNRNLNIEFSYNRPFLGKKDYPDAGSWTRNMRPDYTLSIWPVGISQPLAESEELIVHIHFDAKYKIDKLSSIFGDISDKVQTEDEIQKELSIEKADQNKGTFKRVDLLKMHSYKDAIRRTSGAYILYPGSEKYKRGGFHEIIPGLGAFAIRPSKQNNGSEELKKFLNEVVNHFLNRASQREKMSLKTYLTHLHKDSQEVNETLPETYGENRTLLPDETFVLVAYYKDAQHLEWIKKYRFYNARTGRKRGSLRLSPKETGAKYILLHTLGETKTNILIKVKETGPRIFSKQDMIDSRYPNPDPANYYLVYDIDEVIEKEFKNMKWDITKLTGYKTGMASGIPFSTSLTELMGVLVKS